MRQDPGEARKRRQDRRDGGPESDELIRGHVCSIGQLAANCS